jgi:EF hand
MARFIAGVAAAFLLLTGAFLMWQSKASQTSLAPIPAAEASSRQSLTAESSPVGPRALTPFTREPPEATPKSREQKRFSRADKNDDGRIDKAELFDPRRKAFAKLDGNGNGTLSFEEWANKTVEKFAMADRDRSGWLNAAEYASTAPPPPKRRATCAC